MERSRIKLLYFKHFGCCIIAVAVAVYGSYQYMRFALQLLERMVSEIQSKTMVCALPHCASAAVDNIYRICRVCFYIRSLVRHCGYVANGNRLPDTVFDNKPPLACFEQWRKDANAYRHIEQN